MSGGYACRIHSLGFGVVARRILLVFLFAPFSIIQWIARMYGHGAVSVLVVAKPSVLPSRNP